MSEQAETPDTLDEVDLLVVGGGKAGKSLAMDRAKAGWSVVMVERDKIGGSCINVACIPTKSLVGSARTLLAVRDAQRMGVALDGTAAVSLELLRRHKESVVGGMVAAHETMFEDSGMDFVLGTARFVAERTVEIAADDGTIRTVRGRDVVINTGTTPSLPPLDGLAEVDPWTSESILELERLPESLVIIGGGYVGCELASMFAIFGTRVTLVHGGDQLLPREDRDVADELAQVLRDQGVDVRLGARAERVRREVAALGGSRGEVVVSLDDGSDCAAQDLLVAAGRSAVTGELGLDAAGVEVDERGFVVVDEHLRTSAPNTWAAGDVAGGEQFTHVSWNDFRILRENLSGGDAVTTGRLVPYTVYTTPELARVGLSEADALEQGHRIRVARISAGAVPRATTLHETVGTWKAVVDADTDLILGVALLGHDTGEVMTAVQMAMLGGLTHVQVRDAVIAHPTMAEGLNLLFDALEPGPGRERSG